MADPKFRYLIIDEYYKVYGLSTEAEAREAAEWSIVIDTETGTILGDGTDMDPDEAIKAYDSCPVPPEDQSETDPFADDSSETNG